MINRTGLALFALGALLFAAVFYVATSYNMLGWTAEAGTEEATWLAPPVLVALYTMAFGLPYALWELTRRTNWLAILFVLILIPAAHYAAMYAFLWYTAEGQATEALLMAGFLAGFVGAALSFLALFILGLRSSGAGLAVFGAGLLLLTGWGGLGMKLLNLESESPGALSFILPIYLPWQLIFAFFLSALLRPSPPRGTVATTEATTD
jgi:hypothetical protein